MKKFFLMSFVALLAMTMVSCLGLGYRGNTLADDTPTQVTDTNQVTKMQPFGRVDIEGAFKVIYEQGSEYSVRVEASELALKQMTVYVEDSVLCIHESRYEPATPLDDVKVYVTAPDLFKINLLGSGMFAADNAITVDTCLIVIVMGSGMVQLASVDCHGKAIFSVDEGTNLELGHLKAEETIASIDGSGNINLGSLECKFLRADVTGSGCLNCDNINADEAEINITGSGNVNLKGTVKNVTKEITGKGLLNITHATSADSVK